MTPSEVYSKVARLIDVMDECWVWTGPVTLGQGIPRYAAPKSGWRRVISYAGTFPKNYAMACGQPKCVHPEHVVHTYSDSGRLVFISQNTAAVGDCLEWTGHMDTNNVPSMYVEHEGKVIRNFPVRRASWCIEQIPPGHAWPEGTFGTTCNNPRCVRVEHTDAILQYRTGCDCCSFLGRYNSRHRVPEFTGDTEILPGVLI